MTVKPDVKPARPWFSAGPTAKRAGYALGGLPSDLLGRGIRAPEVVEWFAHGLRLTREVLEVPDSHVMLYTPGSTRARSRRRCGGCWAHGRCRWWPMRTSA